MNQIPSAVLEFAPTQSAAQVLTRSIRQETLSLLRYGRLEIFRVPTSIEPCAWPTTERWLETIEKEVQDKLIVELEADRRKVAVLQ